MGYDQQTYNKISGLEADAAAATSAYTVANATKQALDARLVTFNADLATAQTNQATAQSNYAASKSTDSALQGTLQAALESTFQSLVIYSKVRQVFNQSYVAAQEAMTACYSISDALARITAAEAKNSYITPQLLTAATNADSTAATAMTAAMTALSNSMTAFVAAEQSVWASSLVVASIVDLFRLMDGYIPLVDSDEPEIPDALVDVPPVLPLDGLTTTDRSTLDRLMKEWLFCLFKAITVDDLVKPEYADAWKKIEPPTVTLAQALSQLWPVKPTAGLVAVLKQINDLAVKRETLIQDATTRATKEDSLAAQELARREAALDTIQKALAAAKAAV